MRTTGQIQDGIGDGQLQLAVGRLFHLGLAVQIEADEHDPLFPGLFIEQFLLSVSAQIPIEDEDIHLGIQLFQSQGALYGMGAADPAAVRPLGFPGAHALDEHGLLGAGHLGVFGIDELIELKGRHDVGVGAVQVLFRFVGLTAGGQNGHPVFEPPFALRGRHRGDEIADEAAGVLDGGVEHDLDVGVILHLLDQVIQVALVVIASGADHQVAGLAAQLVALFHQVGLKAHVGDGQG